MQPKPQPPQSVKAIAIALVAFSIISTGFLTLLSGPPGDEVYTRISRFILTCLLAFFLWRGANGARLITIFISFLAVWVSIRGVTSFSSDVPTIYWLWMIVMGAFYAVITAILLFHKPTVNFFRENQLQLEKAESEREARTN